MKLLDRKEILGMGAIEWSILILILLFASRIILYMIAGEWLW